MNEKQSSCIFAQTEYKQCMMLCKAGISKKCFLVLTFSHLAWQICERLERVLRKWMQKLHNFVGATFNTIPKSRMPMLWLYLNFKNWSDFTEFRLDWASPFFAQFCQIDSKIPNLLAQACRVLMHKLSTDKKGGRYCMSRFFLRGYLRSGRSGSK